jgi:hypothetical protein
MSATRADIRTPDMERHRRCGVPRAEVLYGRGRRHGKRMSTKPWKMDALKVDM